MSAPQTFAAITLKTPRLTLREFSVIDAEAIQAYADDPEVTRFTSFGPNTPEVTEKILASWVEEQRTRPGQNGLWLSCGRRMEF